MHESLYSSNNTEIKPKMPHIADKSIDIQIPTLTRKKTVEEVAKPNKDNNTTIPINPQGITYTKYITLLPS